MKFILEPVSNSARQRTGWILLFRILTHAVINRSLDNVLDEVMVSESVSFVASARRRHCLICR